jgi:predicted dinucleotide-utilizing enzyme
VKDTVRIGVVGTGAIAQLAHLPVLAKMRGAELVAVCDNDRPKARSLADRFGVPDVFTDIEDLLELDELEAVVIATPNHLHEPHVLSALAAKRHVLCERPLSLTSRGVERILAAAARGSGRCVWSRSSTVERRTCRPAARLGERARSFNPTAPSWRTSSPWREGKPSTNRRATRSCSTA